MYVQFEEITTLYFNNSLHAKERYTCLNFLIQLGVSSVCITCSKKKRTLEDREWPQRQFNSDMCQHNQMYRVVSC